MLEKLKEEVLKANKLIKEYNLAILTWGNVSGIDREKNMIVIKPSGVDYDDLTVDDLVVVSLDARVVEGKLNPSTDLKTHIELYKSFPEIGGVTHTHSTYAVVFAQANMEIPCLGTTHADNFFGSVPLTRYLTEAEVFEDYERNTGKVIVETMKKYDLHSNPGILVAGHGPFTWGKTPIESVKNSLILEKIAEMAFKTMLLNPDVKDLPEYVIKKHYLRKHGPDSYYGQKNR
ncbi:MAG: L-ribulose-5-phosphate 4-epimerase AraD [Candidatus Marinimicrobia bacterium]|nr:L-ribulose-5-phosphate 4-epimerase AraD [Candidatus Neomarinimicrobiota bacterium]